MAENIPTRKKIVLASLAVLGFALGNFSVTALIMLNMQLTLATAVLDGVLRVSGNLIAAAVILYFISQTIRNKNIVRWKHKATCISLVLLALVLAALNYKLASSFNTFNNMVGETNSVIKQKVLEKLQQNNDAVRKSKLTRLWAQIAYEEKGEIIEYFSPDGKAVLYEPDAASKKSREMFSFFNAYQKMGTSIGISICTIWLVTALAGTIITFRRFYGADN